MAATSHSSIPPSSQRRPNVPRPSSRVSLVPDPPRDLRVTPFEVIDDALERLLAAVPARAALVHVYDREAGAFVVVATRGRDGASASFSLAPPADPLISLAARDARPLAVAFGLGARTDPAERHLRVGVPASVMIVPIIAGRAFVAAFELFDHVGGRGFDATLVEAAAAIARVLGDELAAAGAANGFVLEGVRRSQTGEGPGFTLRAV
jgi:GAF domain-containing protein